jgi:predicted nuclease of restriction endonuclease-like (RecB) superfamily
MKRSADASVCSSPEYRRFIRDLKARIGGAHLSVARAVNRELIMLYLDMGCGIVEKQKLLGWGESVVEQLAKDLRRAFPEMRGFSAANIWRMRQFYQVCSSDEILAQAVRELEHPGMRNQLATFLAPLAPESCRTGPAVSGQGPKLAQAVRELAAAIPWGHHVLLLGRIKTAPKLFYYLCACARFGWSRNVLLNQIKAQAYERARVEKKTHNFPRALPERLAEQANEMLKSTYNLEFLGLRRAVRERELENRLISRLQSFLLELGYGFCFVGRQHRVALGKKEYFIDLLFYHRFLKALVAFDLKVGPFEPEFAGKMDFYLNVLNDHERSPGDQPSIGIILCAEKDDVEVEYALRAKGNPIGVAAYTQQANLPGELRGKLPTARQLAGIVRAELEEGDVTAPRDRRVKPVGVSPSPVTGSGRRLRRAEKEAE